MVGVPGIGPGTSSLSGTRSNQLSYTPGLVEAAGIGPATSCLQSRRSAAELRPRRGCSCPDISRRGGPVLAPPGPRGPGGGAGRRTPEEEFSLSRACGPSPRPAVARGASP